MLRERIQASNYSFLDKLRSIDYLLILLIIAIGSISVFAIYSTEGGKFSFYTKNHIIRLSVFFSLFLVLSFVRVSTWYKNAYLFYIVGLVLLITVLFFGISASGATRWINLYFLNLQPSELMKIAVIICFARYYHRIQSSDIQSYKFLIQPIILLIIPCYLVIQQPDLGTSILIAGSGIAIIWLAGLNIKYFIYSGLLLLVSLPFAISILKPYQKSRILTFFNPDRDPLGAGYQIIQSKIAIGSGGLNGNGFLEGSQSSLDFLPEKETDFVFAIFSEQFGFTGSILLISIFLIFFLIPILKTFKLTQVFNKIILFVLSFKIFFEFLINISMTIGLLPVVGVALPFMSYGGSSLLSNMIICALLMNLMSVEEKKRMFP